ncbi:MAG: retroviral-like aspartic protease family protein [Ardenticatenaceae bacterium]|nr:retroviral-like aspartic protease family protein [Ardenticatenaceae bacterium]
MMVVYTFDYDSSYAGPALPVVELTVRHLLTDEYVSCKAIVDSGADATMIPLNDLHKIGARKVDARWMSGVSGLSYKVDIYEVIIQIGAYTIPKVYAVADRQNQPMILGRDVLNHLVTTLNGLANVVEISQ